MSEHHIVNRISTPQLDAAMAEAGVTPSNPEPGPEHLIKNWRSYPEHFTQTISQNDGKVTATGRGEGPVTVEGQRAPYVGFAEIDDKPLDTPPPVQVQSEPESEEDKLAADIAGQIGHNIGSAFVLKNDFEDFVFKVLAAFKHMGYDMRKF